ncbi:sensor histidine kinase KdpD [Phycicoccus sp. CSK15P-2]|uniref:sensor histidine kinase n=1 Tax=Phycicoccus sp. CSK15P-2 TaxID=2807627 RepID=UPI00194E160C|nr:HAMP domain-containing sensor histidine kinase [Phycicoccus sp. CSK15P-2]
MGPEVSAVVICVLVTAGVGALGSLALMRVSRSRADVAAFGAPLVVVAALAAGVATASGAMLIAEDDQHTILVVLLAGMPVAVAVGFLLARRVRRLEQDSARVHAARERDREVEESRRETIRWLSHDLRTPLAGIRALAESLEDGAVERPVEAYGRIVHEVDRMDGMVDDIAELSRLHGPAAVRREPVDLDDVVSDAVTGVVPLADAAGVEVVAGDLAGEVVLGEARALTRAVSNVVRNAVQHTPAGGTVTVRTAAGDGQVVVEVADGCGGLADEAAARVFDAGWRGDTSRHERGMGLGLTITREVARAHGGDATVANRPEGGGCVVAVRVPTSPAG